MSAENRTPRLSDAIGFIGEVSEPNGPAVKGYFLARWADAVQPQFEKFVAEREQRAVQRAIKEASSWLESEGHARAGAALLQVDASEVASWI